MLFWMSTNVSFCGFFSIQSTTKNTSLLASFASQAYTQENKTHKFMFSFVGLEKPKGKLCLTGKKKKKKKTERKEFLF